MKKVAIVSTGHPPFDERIFNKIGETLLKMNFDVHIVVTTINHIAKIEQIKVIGKDFRNQRFFLLKKISFIMRSMKNINPDLIICSEAFPVIISFLFTLFQRKKIPARLIYDVTEWYPENVYLKRKGLTRIFYFLFGHLINFLATNLSDYLFVGEETKLIRYLKYSPKKKYSIISYYPILEYYKPSTLKVLNNEIIFGYAGVISISRGLDIYYQILKELKKQFIDFNFGFILSGKFEFEKEKHYIDKFSELGITFKYYEWTDYKEFSRNLERVHICLDIRPPNKIYERSLPIKIFDYMALGKCIVASNYEPIKKIFDSANCGILVNPMKFDEIIKSIINLINNKDLIYQYGLNGRNAAEKFFNWKVCEEEMKKALGYLNL